MTETVSENGPVDVGILTSAAPQRRPPVRSIYESSYIEALRFKWIVSEKAGTDLGESAITQWLESHWRGWCRQRWLEHVAGEVCWAEFGRREFGSLRRDFRGDARLLEAVLERLRSGAENLDVILWASECAANIRQVIDILIIADINRPALGQEGFFERGAC